MMIKKMIILFVVMMVASPVYAGQVGFINDQRLAHEAIALQGLQQEFEDNKSSLNNELNKEVEVIVKEKKELQEKEASKSLTNAELGSRMDEIAKKEQNLQQRAQDAGQKLQREFTDALLKFKEEAINPVVQEMAKEKGFDAIIDARSAFFIDNGLDVTDEAISKINEKMPKIDMKKIVFDKISSTESNVNEGKNIEKKQIVKKTPSKKTSVSKNVNKKVKKQGK
ncbi:MAG: OmpH family outer membrane protein [Alphaproteobacteria bacterium]|nr:OmpH family outer membrane protein [Alphaproteobacteria bacterium]